MSTEQTIAISFQTIAISIQTKTTEVKIDFSPFSVIAGHREAQGGDGPARRQRGGERAAGQRAQERDPERAPGHRDRARQDRHLQRPGQQVSDLLAKKLLGL